MEKLLSGLKKVSYAIELLSAQHKKSVFSKLETTLFTIVRYFILFYLKKNSQAKAKRKACEPSITGFVKLQ